MNRKIFVVASLLTLAAFAPKAGWAAGATSSTDFQVYADLLRPITIFKMDDLYFGRIIKNPGAFGTVEINSVDGSIVSSDPDGLMLMGGERRARFRIVCESSFPYTVTLPTTVTLTKIGVVGAPTTDQQLTADTFRGTFDGLSSPFSPGVFRYCDEQTDGSYGDDMEDILWVGAKLHIVATNETGQYFGTGTVTVDYQ